MADKITDHNQTKPDPADGLRGGTQGGGPPPVEPGLAAGGTNSLSTAGAGPPDRGAGGRSGGTRTGDRETAEDAYEGSRHISEAEAKQFGRDAADVGTEPGTPHVTTPPRHHQIHPQEKRDG